MAFTPVPRIVREGLAHYTDEGFKGQAPRVTHASLPGANRSEKRANGKAARRVLVEYKRRGGRIG